MKKKLICLVVAGALLAMQATMAYGAGSTSTSAVITSSRGGSGSSVGSSAKSKPLDLKSLGATGPASNNAGSSNYGVTVSVSNAAGGNAAGGNAAGGAASVRFASDAEVKDLLPAYAAEDVFTINAGTKALFQVVGTADMVGYNPLIPVQTVITDSTEPVNMSVYVPNLVEGLTNVKILFINPDTKKWETTIAAVDYATKTVSVALKSGTPFTVIYK